MVLPVINIGSKLDGKGFKQADTAADKLGKSVKKAGLALAAAFSVQKIVAFGKASVKAFGEDEAAAAKLTRTVNNLGLGFDNVRITKFISDLEKTAAVSDDILRPAFSSLLTTTGSVEKSQKMLALALDVAAGSGEDVTTVTNDLANAYVGNTKGLTKYRLGLTKAELAGKSFNEIQDLLNTQFSGQNATRLDTYAGKMAILGVAAGNAQEIIGKGLVDAISKLGDDDSVQNLADDMETAAERTADVIRGIGVLVAKIKTIPGFNSDFGVLYDISYLALLEKLGKSDRLMPKPFTTPMSISGSTDAQVKIDKARAKAEADAAKREKERLALLKKTALAEKNKLSLSKAAAVFDTNRISIAAALQATYDKETRLRLEALMAIEDEDGATALARIGELAAFQKNADLQKLAGVNTISSATLEAINKQLLTELAAINSSKMAEKDKEAARDIAFGKYNAAITAAGELASKESYIERVQIQLTEIARLASLSNTTNASITAGRLREQAELNMIDRVAAAQKAADDARLKALQEYINLLSKIGGGGSSGLTNIGGTNFVTGPVISTKTILDTVAATAAATSVLGKDISATEFFSSLTSSQQEDLGGYSPYMNYGSGYPATYNVTVQAGVIGNEDTVVSAVQDALQTIYRRGNPIDTAGAL
jgi:hypothetical protein